MKISIIGSGVVGSSIAFAIMDSTDIEMVDIDLEKARAECYDLRDAAQIQNLDTKISYSEHPGKADIYIICVGKRIKESNYNGPVMENKEAVNKILSEIANENPDPWIFMVTNPSGEMAQEALNIFRKVISCGRSLDVSRTKVIGKHENPDILNHYKEIKKGKGFTNWGCAAEVRMLIMGLHV